MPTTRLRRRCAHTLSTPHPSHLQAAATRAERQAFGSTCRPGLQKFVLITSLLATVAGCRATAQQTEVTSHRYPEVAAAPTPEEIPPFDIVEPTDDEFTATESPAPSPTDNLRQRFETEATDDGNQPVPVLLPILEVPPNEEAVARLVESEPMPVEAPVPAELPTTQQTTADMLAQLQLLGATIQHDDEMRVIGIDLAYSQADDDTLDLIRSVSDLQRLDLTATEVTDQGLAKLATLPSLQALTLRGTSVGNDGLEHVSRMTDLELLDLSKTAISNDGLTHLRGLNRLKYLMLAGTDISDTGLASLHPLENLAGLSLTGTRVTRVGVDKLAKTLPNCRIVVKFVNEQSGVEVPLEFQDKAPQPRTLAQSLIAAPEASQRRSPTADFAAAHPEQALALAQRASSTGRWHDAVEILQAAVDSRPHDTMLQFRLGIALARTGNNNAALPYLRTTVGESAAYYNLGLITYEQMLQTSELYFTKALELNSQFPSARSWLADVHRNRNGFNITDAPVQFAESNDFPVSPKAVVQDHNPQPAGPRFHMGDLRSNNLRDTESR